LFDDNDAITAEFTAVAEALAAAAVAFAAIASAFAAIASALAVVDAVGAVVSNEVLTAAVPVPVVGIGDAVNCNAEE
jgi:hypothetical protein